MTLYETQSNGPFRPIEPVIGIPLPSRQEEPETTEYSMHPRVLAFFREQAEIAQQSAPPPALRLPQNIYAIADMNCDARIDSSDWRKREISARSTEIAYDLFMQEIRTPFSRATKQALALLMNSATPPEKKQEILRTHMIKRFPAASLPESDQQHFVLDRKTNSLIVAVPYTLLSEILLKFHGFHEENPAKMAGTALGRDLDHRILNILKYCFQPEWKCFDEFIQSGKSPEVTFLHHTHPADYGALISGGSQKIAEQMRDSGFDPEWTRCLVADRCHKDPRYKRLTEGLIAFGGGLKNMGQVIGW